MPNEVTGRVGRQCYMEAWKAGCKGVTVYRDGSRSGVLISNDEKKTEDANTGESIFPLQRPITLKADVVRFQNNKEKWIAFYRLVGQSSV